MCNACGNECCGSDQFSGCGCDGCDDPDCWSDEQADEFYGSDDVSEDDIRADYFRSIECAHAATSRRLVCEEVRHAEG